LSPVAGRFPSTPFPAVNVTLVIATFFDPATHPAMLDFPFPLPSVPLASGAVKLMSCTTTSPLAPLTVIAALFCGAITLLTVPDAYVHLARSEQSSPP
jgi:hypothetical protein